VDSKSGSDSSSFGSSSGGDDDDDDDDDEPDYLPAKDASRQHQQDESPYDSFEEVNGSESGRKQSNKAPRTSRTEFKNVDAELYDLRRSGRSRRAPRIVDDDEEDEEVTSTP